MDQPADNFTRAASTSGTPGRPPSAFGCLPPPGGGQGELGRGFHLVCGSPFLLQGETLGHLLIGQGLLPRKPPSHLSPEDSLIAAEVGGAPGTGAHQPDLEEEGLWQARWYERAGPKGREQHWPELACSGVSTGTWVLAPSLNFPLD